MLTLQTIVVVPEIGHARRRQRLAMAAQLVGMRSLDPARMPGDQAYQLAATFGILLVEAIEQGIPLRMDEIVNRLAVRLQIAVDGDLPGSLVDS